MRDRLVTWLLVIAALPACASEGEGEAPEPDPGIKAVPYNPTFEPDYNNITPRSGVEPVTAAQQDMVVVQKDSLLFPATEANIKDWQPGRIVVGAPGKGSGSNPFGFARRVVSVKEEKGRLTVQTQAVALQEIIEGDFQVRLDDKGEDVDLSTVDLEWVAKTFYGSERVGSLAGAQGLKGDPSLSAPVAAPGQPGAPWGWPCCEDTINAAGNFIVEKSPVDLTKAKALSEAVGEGVSMAGQVVAGTVKEVGSQALDKTKELGSNVIELVDTKTGQSFTLFKEAINNVVPASFEGSKSFNDTLNKNGTLILLNNAELKKKIDVNKSLALEFFIKGSVAASYDFAFRPGLQVGARVPSPVASNPPPFKFWINVDSWASADFLLGAKFDAGIRTADASDALQDAISEGQEQVEALHNTLRNELEGDDDLKPEGNFTKVLYVSSPKVTTIWAGPVPVSFTSTLMLSLVCGVEVRASIDAKLRVKREATFKFGAQYEAGGGNAFTLTQPPDYTYEELTTKEVLGGGKLVAHCGLVPRVNAYVYDSIGFYAGVRGSLIGTADFKSECQPNTTEPKGKLDLSLDFQAAAQLGLRAQAAGASFLGKEGTELGFETEAWEPWDKTWNLWSKSWDFDKGLGYCTPTCTNQVTSDKEKETDVDCGDACSPCGAGKKCEKDLDCVGRATCAGGICTDDLCNDGLVSADETDADCGGSICGNKCAIDKRCRVAEDCKSNFCSQLTGRCVSDSCEDGERSVGECGVDCGGPCATKCPDFARCGSADDCASGFSNSWVCMPDSCGDYRKSGQETDADCGGPTSCPRCGSDQACSETSDCQAGFECTDGTCQHIPDPTCGDRLRNQDETGVDCGGSCAEVCEPGESCGVPKDCASFVCSDLVCAAPSCSDGVRNGDESSTDCGGGGCPRCGAGFACNIGSDCSTGSCIEGSCASSYALGGSVANLSGTVTLATAGQVVDVDTNGSFNFPENLVIGTPYTVTVMTQPVGQTCNVSNATGTMVVGGVTDVLVVCSSNSYALGGTLSGLDAGSVTLANGSDALTLSADGTFVFGQTVPFDASYDVVVTLQPSGRTCTVQNGAGTMLEGGVSSISVSCVQTSFSVAGVVAGAGSSLVLKNGSELLDLPGDGNFVFTQTLASGAPYAVSVEVPPAGRTCLVTNGSGSIGSSDVTGVSIVCSVNSYEVSGTVSGASGALAIKNGVETLNLAGAGPFKFTQKVPYGALFAVTVTSPPAGQTCTVQNGGGYIADNVTNVVVDCQAASVGTDCEDILAKGNATSGNGIYVIDPDEAGPVPSFPVYCDISKGGFTQIFDNETAKGYLPPSTWRAGIANTAPNGGQWTVMQHMAAFAGKDGKYHFVMRWGDPEDRYVEWTQSQNPLVGRGVVTNLVMKPTSQLGYGGVFAGLGVEYDDRAALDGEAAGNYAWAIGTQNQFGAGVPAYASSSEGGAFQATRVRLYFRRNAQGPRDCAAILQATPAATNGLYSIDADGPGGADPYQAYCDMSGGGWTQILDQDATLGVRTNDAWAIVNDTPPNGGFWSRLYYLQDFATGPLWHFSMRWGQDESKYITWDQTTGANPVNSPERGTVSNVVMNPTSQTGFGGGFMGLAFDYSQQSVLWDGEPSVANGAWSAGVWGSSINAYANSSQGGLVTTRVRIYVKRY